MVLEILIGTEEDVEDCAGGLLAIEIADNPIFSYQLPGELHETTFAPVRFGPSSNLCSFFLLPSRWCFRLRFHVVPSDSY